MAWPWRGLKTLTGTSGSTPPLPFCDFSVYPIIIFFFACTACSMTLCLALLQSGYQCRLCTVLEAEICLLESAQCRCRHFRLPVKELLKEGRNDIELRFSPAPKYAAQQADVSLYTIPYSAVRSCKSILLALTMIYYIELLQCKLTNVSQMMAHS